MSEKVDYLFDVVVRRLETTQVKIESRQDLHVEIYLNQQLFKITSSRINVGDIRPESSFAFRCDPTRLNQRLAQYGMPFSVHYKLVRIGAGTIRFTPEFTDSLLTDNFSELQQVSAQFEHSGEVAGRLEMVCRLYSKCNEEKLITENQTCIDTDNRINPKDLMFVLGNHQPCPAPDDCCPDLEDDEVEDLRLEIERNGYGSDPHRPSQSWQNSPTSSAATCEMKNKIRSEEAVLQSLFKRNNPYQPYVLSNRREETPRREENPNPLDTPWLSLTARRQEPVYCNPPNQTDNNAPLGKPIRFCHICLNNMSWLPTFAACPNCGAKPKLAVKKTEQQNKPTADQIIMDLLGNPMDLPTDPCRPCENVGPEGLKQDQPSGCRCTCRSGKSCAHCRIRKLCADIFQVKDGFPKCKHMDNVKNGSHDIHIDHSTDTLDRPHLAKVFSELRELYKIKSLNPADAVSKKCPQSSMKTKPQSKIYAKKGHPFSSLSQNENQKPKNMPRAGHKHCVKRDPMVPRNHGWSWQESDVRAKSGWQPGSVRKPVKKIMNYFLDYLPQKAAETHETAKSQTETSQPTLRIWKERGEIYISLQSPNNRSNVQMKNITFKIVKSDLATALSEIKNKLKAKGFRKCTCHKSVMLCVCRSAQEKRHLELALHKECQRRDIANCVNELVLTDTSESEMEYDFKVTPPSACRPNISVPQRQTANKETQFSNLDLNIPPKQFIKHSPYWRAYNCAAGDRYTGTAFGKPGEAVIEDGRLKKSRSPKTAKPASKSKKFGTKAFGKGFSNSKDESYTNVKNVKKNMKNVEQTEKKRTVDMMKYLKNHGAFSKKRRRVGPDGLTDAQRRRRELLRVPLMPIELLSKSARTCDPCQNQSYCSSVPPRLNDYCCYPF